MSLFTITPIFGIVFALIVINISMVGFIWTRNMHVPPKLIPIFQAVRGLFFICGSFAALLLLDVVIKVGFLGLLGFGNINYHIGALILMAILGIILLLVCVFSAPTIKTIIIFSGVVVIFIYFFWFNPTEFSIDYEKAFYYPLYFIIPWACIVELSFILIKLIKKKNILEERNLWNISKIVKRYINGKFVFLIWILICIEFILKMEGLDLFFWLK